MEGEVNRSALPGLPPYYAMRALPEAVMKPHPPPWSRCSSLTIQVTSPRVNNVRAEYKNDFGTSE